MYTVGVSTMAGHQVAEALAGEYETWAVGAGTSMPPLSGRAKVAIAYGTEGLGAAKRHLSWAGVVVLAAPSALERLGVPVLDATRADNGMWSTKAGWDPAQLLIALKDGVSAPVAGPSSGPRGDNVGEAPLPVKVRGYIHSFVEAIRLAVPSLQKQLIPQMLGYMLGIVPKQKYQLVVAKALKKGLPPAVVEEFENFHGTKSGLDLIRVFYLLQKGQAFRTLQREHKFISMDDWFMLQEYISSTANHRFISLPKNAKGKKTD